MGKVSKHRKLKTMLYILLSTALVWQMPGAALAAEEMEFQLDQTIITADRTPQTVATTPGNVMVITKQELQNKGAHTLAEALTGLSGIVVKNYGGTGQNSIAYILGTGRVVVLRDGKRMNLPQGVGIGSAGVDINTILLADTVERIEIVYGGASVLYGADAVGGVINIITQKGQEAKTTTTVAGGNYGAKYYSFSTSGRDKNTHWQLSGVQDSSDGQRANSAYKGKSGSFQLEQALSKGEEITFTYDYYGKHAGMPGSVTYPSLTEYQDVLRHEWSVSYAKERSDGRQSLRYYNNDQINSGSSFGSDFRHQNTVRAFEYQDSAKLGNAHLLTWGAEYRTNKVVSTNETGGDHEDTTKALYVQDKYSLNSLASLTVGLRRDENDLYGTHWLPQAAYLYQPNSTVSYFANWSKVFKAPSFDDLYAYYGVGYTGNPNLKPESGWTAEIGVKSKLSTVSEATFSLFKRNISDAIRWTMDADYTYHPHNLEHYQASGVNVNFTTRLSPVTTTDVGYTYLDSRDGNDNNIGEAHNTFHIAFNLHTGKLTQNVSGIYQDQSGATTTSQISGNFVVNTYTNFSLDKKTAIYLRVNNLLDRQYQENKGYPANGRMFMLGIKRDL